MTAVVAMAAGFALGLLAVALLWRPLVETRAARQLERWRADGDRSAVRRHLDAHRAGIKVQLGTELTEFLPAFPFEPTDARFLGHPAQFVVFAGHTAVKDRLQTELAEVVFVTLRSEDREPEDASLLEECVRAGRVRWATLRVDTHAPGELPPDRTTGIALGKPSLPGTTVALDGRDALQKPPRKAASRKTGWRDESSGEPR